MMIDVDKGLILSYVSIMYVSEMYPWDGNSISLCILKKNPIVSMCLDKMVDGGRKISSCVEHYKNKKKSQPQDKISFFQTLLVF